MHELYRSHKVVQYNVQAISCAFFFLSLQLKQIYIVAQIYTDI